MRDDSIKFSQLPRATRVILKLWSKNNHPIGWVGCHLFAFDHQLRTGGVKLQLWPGACPTANATSMENKGDGADQQVSLSLSLSPSLSLSLTLSLSLSLSLTLTLTLTPSHSGCQSSFWPRQA